MSKAVIANNKTDDRAINHILISFSILLLWRLKYIT